MLSVSSFLPGATGQPMLGLKYRKGKEMKKSAEVRLSAYYVKALWRSWVEAKRSPFILHIRSEIINEPLTPQHEK